MSNPHADRLYRRMKDLEHLVGIVRATQGWGFPYAASLPGSRRMAARISSSSTAV